jgi:riboflavin kinase/FMN adenylyltransferase
MSHPRKLSAKLHQTIQLKNVLVVTGSGRGKKIGIPTINVTLAAVPEDLPRGIYACRITLGDKTYPGALHYGPRPVFQDTESMEIHVIDANITDVPATVDLEIVAFIRSVADFPDVPALLVAIRNDIAAARGILAHA